MIAVSPKRSSAKLGGSCCGTRIVAGRYVTHPAHVNASAQRAYKALWVSSSRTSEGNAHPAKARLRREMSR